MFLLKKAIGSFVMPLPIFLFLFLIGVYLLYRGRQHRAFVVISLSFIWISLLSYAPLSSLLIAPLEQPYKAVEIDDNKTKYIHVLGASHICSDFAPLSSQPSLVGTVRILEGVLIYKKHPDMKMIFSGYNGGSNLSTAKKNAMLALALGVKERDIILFEEPKDTIEEAKAVKSFLGDERLVLVTSATHMRRALQIFHKLGIDAIPAPTDFKIKKRGMQNDFLKAIDDLLVLPSAEGLARSEIAFHEYLGLLWSWFNGYI